MNNIFTNTIVEQNVYTHFKYKDPYSYAATTGINKFQIFSRVLWCDASPTWGEACVFRGTHTHKHEMSKTFVTRQARIASQYSAQYLFERKLIPVVTASHFVAYIKTHRILLLGSFFSNARQDDIETFFYKQYPFHEFYIFS